ncbi:MAG: deoxyribose-phosphate aldolase [Candidatus Promineifilaceae bacterium]|nr:deoxyribose-phosphate aldolase [Candidatus Promineifilaceae bacterium]
MSDNNHNPGIPLDMNWVMSAHVNRSAAERRVATLVNRRSIKKEWQAAWLLKAITMIDLTTLEGSDTAGRVERLAAKAQQPVRQDLLDAVGMGERDLNVGAVCVYPNRVRDAVRALRDSDIPVAAVAPGFPSGQVPVEMQLEEIEKSIEAGAKEIDIVISREHVHTGNWQALYDEIRLLSETCGEAAHMKTIIETGELGTLTNVYRTSLVAMMAGSDFIKTSTGKASENATLVVGLVMVRAIREYYERTGYRVGFKPAGGIRTAKDALNWLVLIKEELGDAWLTPSLFRFGASSLLGDIERQLSHHVTGRYAAHRYMPMP